MKELFSKFSGLFVKRGEQPVSVAGVETSTSEAPKAPLPPLSREWEDKVYIFEPEGDVEEFNKWFNEVSPKMPHCGYCNQLIFPGEPVGISIDNEKQREVFLHMNMACCSSGGFYAGHISNEGMLIPAFPRITTAAGHALQTRQTVVVPEIKNLYE